MDSRRKIGMLTVAIWSALFLILSPQATANGISPEAKKLLVSACAQSAKPDACLATLSRNPKASSAKDMLAVANIALAAVQDESRTTQGVLRTKAGQVFKECVSYFEDTIKQLVIKNGELSAGMASLDVHYALDSVGRCETAMAHAKINVAAVNQKIHQWKDMFGVAYFAVTEAENAASGM